MNCHKESFMYNWMQSSWETLTFCFIFGTPIPKEKANGNIFFDVHLLKVSINATICQQCGCWMLKHCKSKFIRQTVYRCVLWWFLRWGEIMPPTFNVSFHNYIDWFVCAVSCSWSSTKSGLGHSSGTVVFWKPRWPDSFTNHVKMSMNNCVSTTALLCTICF